MQNTLFGYYESMYRTPKQKRRYLVTTAILAIGIPLTVLAGYIGIRYFTGATGDPTPKNVVISNVTNSAATISWTTEAQTAGSVIVNEGTPSLDIRGASRRNTHYVEIGDLDPQKEYTFTIKSNSTEYTDEEGNSFKFKTTPISTQTPVPNPIYGSIIGASSDDALVYAVVQGSTAFPASAVINSGGNWILDLSAIRDESANLVKVEADTQMILVAQSSDGQGVRIIGTYSDIFDTDGKVKETNSMVLAPTASLLANFPASSVISQVVSSGTGGGNLEEETPSTEQPEEEPTTEEPEEEEEPEEPTVGREFRLVLDVNWKSISNTSPSTTSVNVATGEDSVQITNITDNSFTVVWVTKTAVEGSVDYGTSATALNSIAIDERDNITSKGKYTSHSVKIDELEPQTQYFFEINSGTDTIKNGAAAFSITTFATLDTPPEFKTVSGKITGAEDPEDAVIVVHIKNGDSDGTSGNSTLTSAVPDSSGNWIVTIGELRNSTGSEYYDISSGDKLIAQPVVFANADEVEESADGIEEKTVQVAVKGVSDTDRNFVKVAALSDYGFTSFGTGGGNVEDLDDDDNPVIDPGTDATPSTGLSLPFIITALLGGVFVGTGTILVRKSKPEVVRKSMVDSVL